jgi:MFS family permease
VSATHSLGYLLRQRKVWGLTLGFAAYGYSFYLLLTWLPGYLETQLHMTVLKSGWYTIIPWIVATITDLLIGGWLVDRLIEHGYKATRVRKTLLVIGMALGLAVIRCGLYRNGPESPVTLARGGRAL